MIVISILIINHALSYQHSIHRWYGDTIWYQQDRLLIHPHTSSSSQRHSRLCTMDIEKYAVDWNDHSHPRAVSYFVESEHDTCVTDVTSLFPDLSMHNQSPQGSMWRRPDNQHHKNTHIHRADINKMNAVAIPYISFFLPHHSFIADTSKSSW